MSPPQIPGYRFVRELGRGGMASVYLAIDERSDREVAVKVIDSALLEDEVFSRRFRRESQIVAGLDHPHIIRVFDVGLADEHYFLVMELVTGGDLNERLEVGIDAASAFRVVREMARALDFAHAANFVHRDLKPENILFREDGSAVLSDFGIARGMDSDTQITTLGSVVGTPYYMSPEQVTGEKLDGRSDLYSLGVVFYRILAGKVPYDGDSALNIGIRHVRDPLPQLPSGLEEMQSIVDRFLAKAPAERFQSGAEVVEALQAFERSNAMPRAVAMTEIIDSGTVDEIRRRTGREPVAASHADTSGGPSATRVAQVPRRSPARFVVIGVGLAMILAAAAWLLLLRDGGNGVDAAAPDARSGAAAQERRSQPDQSFAAPCAPAKLGHRHV